MIKDYKGEMPNNVTTPDKAKAQKPFYKNWKFWVLTGLMTLFGACSVYGLVLGSQYVKAIERASHIIADAQQPQSEGLRKEPQKLPGNGSIAFDISIEYAISNSQPVYYDFSGSYTENPSYGRPYWRVYAQLFSLVYRASSDYLLAAYDYVPDLTYNFPVNSNSWVNFYPPFTPSADTPLLLKGTFYYRPYESGSSYGYQSGYDDGYGDGYQGGYSDGSDAINVPQSLKVLLPVGNQYSVQYSSYVDGVLDQQGQINSSQSAGAWALFTRSRNKKLRVDLTLPVDSQAFWDFRSGWTSGSEVAGDYTALRQSWAVDGVTYLPTWIGEPQLYVGVVGTNVPDLTYRTISIAFDVAHWGDIKVGAYAEGYSDGYQDGESNPTAYQSGYDAGYEQGHDAGEIAGYNRGIGDGTNGSKALLQMFVTAFQQPFNQLYRFLNFNLLGINFLGLFTAMLTVGIGIYIIKKVL